MEIVEQIVGAYIPLCCLSIPVLGFLLLVALLPAGFIALSSQGEKEGSRKKSRE